MSKNEKLIIKVPPVATRLEWTDTASTGFTDEQVFEIIQRYCDQQGHRKASQNKRNNRIKLLTKRTQELADAAGVTVDEYLEIEAKNLGIGKGEAE